MAKLGPNSPLVLAHRGARRVEAENTIGAFTRAIEMGADGVELDVHRTDDDVLLVHHDADIPGLGIISDLSAQVIRSERHDIPTLDEVFSACPNCIINVEIKNALGDLDYDESNRVADLVVDAVANQPRPDDVIVSSFNIASIDRVKDLSPALRTGFLVSPTLDLTTAATLTCDHGHNAVHPFILMLGGELGSEFTETAHSLGLSVNVWTVNEASDIEHSIKIGVDAIITDVPDLAKAVQRSVTSAQ